MKVGGEEGGREGVKVGEEEGGREGVKVGGGRRGGGSESRGATAVTTVPVYLAITQTASSHKAVSLCRT